MSRLALTFAILVGWMGTAMAQDRISIVSEWGTVHGTIVEGAAGSALLGMLPVTLEMRDHLRQEKTGELPAPLPPADRQLDFSPGTIGLWGTNDFVVYYRQGRVPRPGIVVLGRIEGDVSIFDRPGPVTFRIERSEP